MRQAFARHWRWFIVAAIPLDIAIVTVPHITGDFTNAMLIFPIRWLVMMGGAFSMRCAQQSGAISLRAFGWAAIYLVFGFTASALLGGAFSG